MFRGVDLATLHNFINFMDISVSKGDLKNKLKKGKLCMNNTKAIGNSINHHDNRMEHEYMNHHEEDTIR